MPAAEHIERQITVVVVIAVEETLFLMPVQRVVGGVEVQGDLRRRRRMGVEKQLDKQSLDRRRVVADLVIAGRLPPAQFQPTEPRFAGQRPPARPSTGAKPNRSALHSVCIGNSPASETNRSRNTIFSDPGPRCTYPV